MLDNPPLLTIHRGHRRPDRALIEAFRGAQTSHLADAMEGRGALDYRIKPMDPDNAVFVGSALTALAYPADVVGVYGALLEAEAGDVIEGTGGVRKIRKADPRRGKGKRGGLRVIYYWWLDGAQFWLFTVYDKDQADDLTAEQRKVVKRLLDAERQQRQKNGGKN